MNETLKKYKKPLIRYDSHRIKNNLEYVLALSIGLDNYKSYYYFYLDYGNLIKNKSLHYHL